MHITPQHISPQDRVPMCWSKLERIYAYLLKKSLDSKSHRDPQVVGKSRDVNDNLSRPRSTRHLPYLSSPKGHIGGNRVVFSHLDQVSLKYSGYDVVYPLNIGIARTIAHLTSMVVVTGGTSITSSSLWLLLSRSFSNQPQSSPKTTLNLTPIPFIEY